MLSNLLINISELAITIQYKSSLKFLRGKTSNILDNTVEHIKRLSDSQRTHFCKQALTIYIK